MASSLSDEEFQRMQEQLIELRTTNYNLEEGKRKHGVELKTLQDRIYSLEEELNKSNKTISKSKKMKEVEGIITENQSLLRKLQNQEDEFRLQNTTIMQELSSLISANEKLEGEIAVLKDKQTYTDVKKDPELCRLQAENTILHKNLTDVKEKYEKLSVLERKLRAQSGNTELEVEESEVPESLTSCDPSASKDISTLTDFKMKYEIKEEENRILKEQLESINKTLNENQAELSKVNDKLKKKQESIIQLQKEKEDMYNDHLKSSEDLNKTKNEEISQLKGMTCRLQTQLNNALDTAQEYKTKTAKHIVELEQKCEQLQAQTNDLSSSDPERVKVLEEEAIKLKTSAETAWVERDNQVRALKDALANSQVQTETIQLLQKAKMEAENNESEASKLAEKRKSLLDQMAVHLQTLTDKHSEEMLATTNKFNSKIDELSSNLEAEKRKTQKIEKYKDKIESLNEDVKSLESSKSWLERRLQESEEEIKDNQLKQEKFIEEMKEQRSQEISVLKSEHDKEIQDFNVQLELAKVQKTEFEEAVERLQQEAKDSIEDRKIREKKGIGIVKDLKRQLNAERRQVEKLQERIQDLLNETNQSRTSVDELLCGGEHNDKRGDNGSVGSWSLMSGGTADNSTVTRESLHNVSDNDAAQDRQFSHGAEHENQELIARLAEVQQQKWDLEEKLNHLEISNSAMAEDIMTKSSIIQHYCMEGRPDPQHIHASPDKLTVKRVVDFIKDKGDENLRDINRKLQRMLEETLTKNMHLQKNLETLSQQL